MLIIFYKGSSQSYFFYIVMDFFKIEVADYARYLLQRNLFTKCHSREGVKPVTEAKYCFEFFTKKV